MTKITLYYNCLLLKDHKIVKDTLWIQDDSIVDPESINYMFDYSVDCRGSIIAPGLIDLKVNGHEDVDFSSSQNIQEDVKKIAIKIVANGVTAFCPTITSSSPEYYHKTLPRIKKTEGSVENGATVLGVHLDGPFISPNNCGGHLKKYLQSLEKGFEDLLKVYGDLSGVAIITIAPELNNSITAIRQLVSKNIHVSLGHSDCSLAVAEHAVKAGANMVTHLFNGMPAFHHRDPSLVGLLASDSFLNVFFSLIADGVHTNPAALKIAYKLKPDRIFLISDSLATSLPTLGEIPIEIHEFPKKYFTIEGSNILCGSTSTLDACVCSMKEATNCSLEYALEAASLHPARAIGISDKYGKLNFGYKADFIFIQPKTHTVLATYINGVQVYHSEVYNFEQVPCDVST